MRKSRAITGTAILRLSDGKIIVANAEFKAKSGRIDGMIVYKSGMKYQASGKLLSAAETDALLLVYAEYEKANGDIISWA